MKRLLLLFILMVSINVYSNTFDNEINQIDKVEQVADEMVSFDGIFYNDNYEAKAEYNRDINSFKEAGLSFTKNYFKIEQHLLQEVDRTLRINTFLSIEGTHRTQMSLFKYKQATKKLSKFAVFIPPLKVS